MSVKYLTKFQRKYIENLNDLQYDASLPYRLNSFIDRPVLNIDHCDSCGTLISKESAHQVNIDIHQFNRYYQPTHSGAIQYALDNPRIRLCDTCMEEFYEVLWKFFGSNEVDENIHSEAYENIQKIKNEK